MQSGVVDVRVTTPGGTSAIAAGDQFTYSAILPGSILIGSVPDGADVYIDNVLQVLKTNNTFIGVADGEHTVKVTNTGYFNASRQVTVVSGDTASVSVTMDAIPSTAVLDPIVIDAVKVVLKEKN